jgi:DNA mismatch endonuclease (patch repair protein)
MQRQARRDTAPELALRRALYRLGLRYRVDVSPIPGMRSRADIVFAPRHVAVFVDGCFWHSCPDHGTIPKSNRDWWTRKLRANTERDRDIDKRLRTAGWHVIRVWEHEDAEGVARKIEPIVRRHRQGST